MKIRSIVLSLVAAATLSGPVLLGGSASAALDEHKPVGERPGVGTSSITKQDVTASATITRDQVLTRARSWVDANVKYSQSKIYGNQYGTYRTDCSGFVSMAWGLTPSGISSPNTNSLPQYGTWLNSLDDLRPGDAIDKPGSHVVLFVSWADSGHTVANVYEETSYTDEEGPDPGTIASRWTRTSLINGGYRPLRYNNIVDSPGGKYEVGVYRASEGRFHLRDHNGQLFYVQWGASGDVPVTGDWNGDGRSEVGVYRASEGRFHLRDHNGTLFYVNWGAAGDVPVTGDWNGDGKFEVGVYRASEGRFHLRDHNGQLFYVNWGGTGDIPVTGDWNGDGKFEVGIYRPSEGRFHLRDHNGTLFYVNWGAAGDVPVTGDWNGDGKFEVGVYRASEGRFHLRDHNAQLFYVNWGGVGDVPLAADWNGA